MKYYKYIQDGYILAVHENETSLEIENFIELTPDEYKNILSLTENKPEDTDEVVYMLRDDTLEYEATPAPPKPEPVEPTYPYGLTDEQVADVEQVYRDKLSEEVSGNA